MIAALRQMEKNDSLQCARTRLGLYFRVVLDIRVDSPITGYSPRVSLRNSGQIKLGR